MGAPSSLQHCPAPAHAPAPAPRMLHSACSETIHGRDRGRGRYAAVHTQPSCWLAWHLAGIPKFYRWLSERYPLVRIGRMQVHACEPRDRGRGAARSSHLHPRIRVIMAHEQPPPPQLNMKISSTEATPEIDNLYLDMNGIIHNCTHANNAQVTNRTHTHARACTHGPRLHACMHTPARGARSTACVRGRPACMRPMQTAAHTRTPTHPMTHPMTLPR
jgi:hypothetical protein